MAAPPALTFRALQVFAATIEARSVSRAAKRLGMSPSSVSQQLSNLEAALGARLIERNARMFRITRAGALFRERAARLLDDVDAAKAELALADQTPSVRLRIATIEDFDRTVTPHWLGRLSARFPKMSFSISSGASHENHDALANRAADLILAVDAIDPVEWVTSHEILRDTFVMVTPNDRADVETLDDLRGRTFLRYASDLYIGRQIEAALRRSRMRPTFSFECTTNGVLFALVAETGGWAITTALSVLGTPPARHALRVQRLPLPGFSRTLALHARRDSLGGLPAILAGQLRASIEATLVKRIEETPGLEKGDLEILQLSTEKPN